MSDYINNIMMFGVKFLVITIMLIGLVQIFIYFVQLLVTIYVLLKNPNKERKIQTENDGISHPITIILPAYNESVTIIDSIESTLATHYPNVEMIVVNDGSTDNTFSKVKDYFDLQPIAHHLNERNQLSHAKIRDVYVSRKDSRLRVIDKENGGKADAHNAAINLSNSPIICLIDADSILAPDAINKAVVPLIDDPKTVAVGGAVRVANSCSIRNGIISKINLSKRFIVQIQILEYMRVFLLAKIAWNHFNTLPIISGAFGLFRRDFAIKVGGFCVGSVGEDYDITLKLHKYIYDSNVDYKIDYVPTAICWTQVPEKWKVLKNQRIRWHIGALQTFINFKSLTFKLKYKKLSLMLLPFSILTDILGPISELLGYFLIPLIWSLDMIDSNVMLSYFLIVFGYNSLISAFAIAIDGVLLSGLDKTRYLLKLFITALLDNFGYRQLYLYWKLKGYARLIKGNLSWGKMERVKFDK